MQSKKKNKESFNIDINGDVINFFKIRKNTWLGFNYQDIRIELSLDKNGMYDAECTKSGTSIGHGTGATVEEAAIEAIDVVYNEVGRIRAIMQLVI